MYFVIHTLSKKLTQLLFDLLTFLLLKILTFFNIFLT